MNQRLQKIYDEITFQNREAFLQNQVVPDINWGKKINGATLQINLSGPVKDHIQKYQEDLLRLEANSLLLSPRPFQHISFNQVVYWNGHYSKGVSATWDELEREFVNKFKQLDNKFPSFPITFYKLIAHTNAIIWCAYDENDELESLRNQLFNLLTFPKETEKRNHIIHTTIARYKQKLNNPSQILDYVNSHIEKVAMNITAIVLRKENQYPSLNTREITSIQLC